MSRFIVGAEFFQKKVFCIFASSFKICFWAVVINDWKRIIDFTILLKIANYPSTARFLIFHIFNTGWVSVTFLKIFFPLSIFRCKRSK